MTIPRDLENADGDIANAYRKIEKAENKMCLQQMNKEAECIVSPPSLGGALTIWRVGCLSPCPRGTKQKTEDRLMLMELTWRQVQAGLERRKATLGADLYPRLLPLSISQLEATLIRESRDQLVSSLPVVAWEVSNEKDGGAVGMQLM